MRLIVRSLLSVPVTILNFWVQKKVADRDCCGRSFGRKRGRIAPKRGDYGHATADEVGHERWQAIVLALQPMVLDRRVLALDVAGFVESFTERSDLAQRGVRRPAADEADDRQRRLLRASRGLAPIGLQDYKATVAIRRGNREGAGE